MVYQCLQCGEAFPGGSSELLKGCPGCGGTRFFFTQKPLGEAARRDKEEDSKADLKNVLLGLLADEERADTSRSWKELLQVDPEVVKEAMEEIRQRAPETPEGEDVVATLRRQSTLSEHVPPAPETTGADTDAAEEGEDAPEEEDAPADVPVGTVNVEAPGKYEIDVERLMESNPVVVEKDGVYMIHLASVFDTNRDASREEETPP